MAALEFSRLVLKSRINVINLRNTNGILRKLKYWRGKRKILQAGSPLLQNFNESTGKSDRKQTSQKLGCDKFSHLFVVLGVNTLGSINTLGSHLKSY